MARTLSAGGQAPQPAFAMQSPAAPTTAATAERQPFGLSLEEWLVIFAAAQAVMMVALIVEGR